MSKHERAKRLLRYEIISLETGIALTRGTDSMLAKWQEEADAFTYALAVLEAAEGVEAEMIPVLHWRADLLRVAEQKMDAKDLDDIASVLQAILDAKYEKGEAVRSANE